MGYLSGGSALTHTSTSATGAKMPRADRIMSAFVPVITTVVTTAMSTVITVAHTRRGERSIVAAASAPTDPNTRAVAAVALTMGTVEREAERDLGTEHRRHRDDGDGAGSADDDQERHREHHDGTDPARDPQPPWHAVRRGNPDGRQRLDR